MNIGLFYQSGYRYVAAYYALEQFRKFYPAAPISLYEDNSDVLFRVAKMFGCNYKKIVMNGGRNETNSGRPAFNLQTTLAWFDRVYDACTTTLSSVEWVINFEDDVWFLRTIQIIPKYDLSGIGGLEMSKGICDYLNIPVKPIFGCGGAAFNREKFLISYEKLKKVDWEAVIKIDRKPSEWTDSALSFAFINANLTTGYWDDARMYSNSDAPYLDGRRSWPGTIADLEKKQSDAALIHCWKPYYYPTKEEINYVDKKLSDIC